MHVSARRHAGSDIVAVQVRVSQQSFREQLNRSGGCNKCEQPAVGAVYLLRKQESVRLASVEQQLIQLLTEIFWNSDQQYGQQTKSKGLSRTRTRESALWLQLMAASTLLE